MKHSPPPFPLPRRCGRWLLVLLMLAGALPARGQVVAGRVTDPAGAPLAGVNVVLGGTGYGAATDAAGRYRIGGAAPGTYMVVASALGFQTARQRVTLAAGTDATVDFVLGEAVLRTDEVVVTASRREEALRRVPASVSVLTAEDLTTRNAVGLDDALRVVPGVQLQGNQVNIRGSSGFAYNTGSRVLLLLDGLPLLNPDADGVPFDALPLAQIERVEVLKGPGSALYGSGALGGVIQVLTKDFPERPETSVRLFAGAYEPVRYAVWRAGWAEADQPRPFGGATVAHARRFGETAGMWVNVAYRNDAGYLNFSKERFVQGFAKVGWQPRPALRLALLAGVLNRERDNFLFWNGGRDALNPGTLAFGTNTDPTGTNDVNTTQVSLFPTLTHAVSARLFYSVKARLFGTIIRPLDAAGRPKPVAEGTRGFRYGGEAQLNLAPRPGRHLTAGVAFDVNLTRASLYVTPDGDDLGNQPEAALFAQWEEAPTDRLRLVGGVRLDGYRIDTGETITRLSPKLAAAFDATETVTLRLAAGRGFRVPSLAERFTDNRDFIPIVRNLTLRPEVSTSVELGGRARFPLGAHGLSLDLALFWNEYDHLIEPTFVPTAQAFQFINLNAARIRGLEAIIEAALFDARARLRIGYTLLDATDRTLGLPLAFRPRHLVLASAEARLYGPLEAGLDYRFASAPARIDSDFARFVPDADVLVDTRVLDLRLGVRRPRWQAALLLNNATEYYYLERPALLGPPRHLTLRLQIDV